MVKTYAELEKKRGLTPEEAVRWFLGYKSPESKIPCPSITSLIVCGEQRQ